MALPRKVVFRRIPVELDEQLRKLQTDIKFQVGIDVTLVNAGRAASKLLSKDVNILKVVPIHDKKKRVRVQFE